MPSRFRVFLVKVAVRIFVFPVIFAFSAISPALALQENSWNWRNELTSTFEPDLGEIFYGYDSKGQRVSKNWVKPTSEVIKTHYPTDSFNVTYNPDGSETITKHIFLNGFPIATIETIKDPTGAKQTKTYINHPDHLNSVTAVSDEKADDVEHLLYQSFGRSLRGPNSIHQEQRNFTSHELDKETNYLYAGSRYLDPTIGRFLSQDPAYLNSPEIYLADPQQANSYSYGRNNPLLFVDRDGRKVEIFAKAIEANSWGTHVFLKIQPDNINNFGQVDGRNWWTLGAYHGDEEKHNLQKMQNAPADVTATIHGYSVPELKLGQVKAIEEVKPPSGVSDTNFIKSIMAGFKSYKDDAIYDPFSLEGYNSNNLTTSLIINAGAKLPFGGNAPGLDPGFGQAMPINYRKADGTNLIPDGTLGGLSAIGKYGAKNASNVITTGVNRVWNGVKNFAGDIWNRIFSK